MINLIYKQGNGQKMARPVTSKEEYLALRNASGNVKNFYVARSGDEKAKARQLQFNYNDLLPDGVLKGCCHPSSTFAHDIDCGDAQEQTRIKDEILAKKDEIGLLELSGSARYGLHAVCRREIGKTVRECQYALSMATRTEYDTNARGLARVMYTGPASVDNLFYLDDAIFEEALSVEESEKEFERLKERERRDEEEIPKSAKKANKHYRPWEEAADANIKKKVATDQTPSDPKKEYPKEYHGIPFTEILKKYWEVNNGGYEPTEGDRDTMTFQLASDLRHICGKNFDWLDQVIPCYDNFPLEEKRQKIRNALESRFEGFPQRLRDTLNALEGKSRAMASEKQDVEADSQSSEPTTMNSSLSEIYASDKPPLMPEEQPELVKLLTKNSPNEYKPTVAHSIFPPLSVHMKDAKFLYTDNVLHEPTLMAIAMAGTGAGKGCIDEPINRIMADIRQRDEENVRRLNEWNKENNRKGANKDKMERPDDLIIQEIDADVTHAAFVQRLDEAKGRFLYFKLNEIELFDKLKGSGGQQFVIMCQAFDPNNRYGQTRAGSQSVNAKVTIRFNWNASGTIGAVTKYFSRQLTKGPISRINFCTIPEREIGSDQPIYGIYDEEFDKQLQPYIKNLTETHGVIECNQARELAKKLIEECAEFSRLSQDRVFENLSFRANIIAWLKACVLYVANGCKWENSMEEFIRWSLHYDLWCKMHYFADDIRKEEYRGERNGQRGPRNLLELLPKEFTLDDAKLVRQRQGISNENHRAIKMIRTWINRGYVIQNTEYSFEKINWK